MKDYYYFVRDHRGGLNESMKTMEYIDFDDFKKRINSGNYEFYAFDDRVNQFLWILKHMDKDYLDNPTWLGIGFSNVLHESSRF